MTPKRPKREKTELKGDLAGYKLNVRRVKQPLFQTSQVKPQPFGPDLTCGQTYLAKELDTDIWETCTMKDIANPDYKPFLAIPSREGYAVWDVEKEIPVFCSDRGIFKQYKPRPENAVVTDKNILFNANGHKGLAGSLIFHQFETELLKGLAQPVEEIEKEELYEEWIEALNPEYGEPE
jgi:hypothetical protein